jgi:hypothetical protein
MARTGLRVRLSRASLASLGPGLADEGALDGPATVSATRSLLDAAS